MINRWILAVHDQTVCLLRLVIWLDWSNFKETKHIHIKVKYGKTAFRVSHMLLHSTRVALHLYPMGTGEHFFSGLLVIDQATIVQRTPKLCLRPGFHMKSLFKESPSIQVNNLHRERESLHPRMLQRGNMWSNLEVVVTHSWLRN